MIENAGTIYAEIRLEIDEFKRGVVDAQKLDFAPFGRHH
jgi:hypothetical protein